MELQSVTQLTQIINSKVYPLYAEGFQAIKEEDPKYAPKDNLISKPAVMRGILLGMVVQLNQKALEEKNWAFSNLKEFFGARETPEKIEASLKFKGKMLLGLKEYPRLNLRRAFWRWYLNTTGSGENLFQRAANNLVLYTNINKITAFYRLLGTVRSRHFKVHPRVKRMTTMLYLYARLFFDRTKRDAFNKIKTQGKPRKLAIAEKLI